MNASAIGLNPEKVRRLEEPYRAASKKLSEAAEGIVQEGRRVRWVGEDGDEFRRKLERLGRNVGPECSRRLIRAARKLNGHREMQEEASKSLEGPAGKGPGTSETPGPGGGSNGGGGLSLIHI